MLRFIFNYYMVLKTCWIILAFQLVGFIGLVEMEQGADILQSLRLTGGDITVAHTWFAMFGLMWWSWQSWRSSRAILHFTHFSFVKISNQYAVQAQVLIPRLLGVLPMLIFSYGIYRVSGWNNALIYVFLSMALWLFVFFHIRKNLIVLFRSLKRLKYFHFPDYVPIKNEAYPAQFIWAKQGRWIIFRLAMVTAVFALIIIEPVSFSRLLGSSAIILFALGSWLAIATLLDFAEKHYSFPFSFTIVAMIIVFSFFNNNHAIRTLEKTEEVRSTIDDHFHRWYTQRYNGKDTVPVFLVAGQGGGVRSAYWMAQVLSELHETSSQFDANTYAFSLVSGGSLGVATYKGLLKSNQEPKHASHRILSQDFLSPVTSWLVVTDLIQQFLPFPVRSIDRARALEYSWEESVRSASSDFLSKGFLSSYAEDDCMYMFSSTRSENGFRTMLSNVQVPDSVFSQTEDLFSVIGRDIPLSTAISVGARFPFVTPPALIYDREGKKWGHLVDGGYVENMGAMALLELYEHLQQLARKREYKLKFTFVLIKNTREEYSSPISGMNEVLAPLNAMSKVWVNSGYYDENSAEFKNLYHQDRAVFVSLDRSDNSIIPLGWYLSKNATHLMQNQLPQQTEHLKLILRKEFESQ